MIRHNKFTNITAIYLFGFFVTFDGSKQSQMLIQSRSLSVGIKLEVLYRLNMKNWKPAFKPLVKLRKIIEANFSQICDQFYDFSQLLKTKNTAFRPNYQENLRLHFPAKYHIND